MEASSPQDQLAEALAAGDVAAAVRYLDAAEFPAGLIARLSTDEQVQLFTGIAPTDAARFLMQLPDAISVPILEALPVTAAATILNQLPSDEQTDLIGLLDAEHATQVLDAMAPAEVADVERLRAYPPDTAGGLMITEYLAFRENESGAKAVEDLRAGAARYAKYPAQYMYIVGDDQTLRGVMHLRDLLFFHGDQPLASAMIRDPAKLSVTAQIEDMRQFFDKYRFLAAPVVDEQDRLVGVVMRSAVEEAAADRAEHMLMRFGGIFSGEEFRTMPLLVRTSRRLAWLGITIVLNLLSATVIGIFDDTLSAVIALAVFLPVISGMSGNAGNQAIAVTMRELALGLITPQEIGWVIGKEILGASLNGMLLGVALGLAAYLWQGNVYLGVLVAIAQAASIVIATCLGATLPLALMRLSIDPALAAAPILTTISDACGFLLTLGFAALILPFLL